MAKYLVIVESPAKAKTIKKFLGSSYKIEASMGHVRDLPKSQLGIDVENQFNPKYITIRGKGDIVAKLKKEAKSATKVYLATDPDREGEAISWHLSHMLNLDPEQPNRITFNEITKNAVKNSVKQARTINMDLVDAQQARRVLDRLVGYTISPLLWKKVKKGLSAGRVQSVAVKMICDREEEIDNFIPEEYWTLDVILYPGKDKKQKFTAKFYGDQSKKLDIKSKEEMDQLIQSIQNEAFQVTDVQKGTRNRKPGAPFTTSTLQQEAARYLNFSTQKTMRVAQQLYEGIDIKGEGTVGLVTYIRTDSVRVSDEAYEEAKAFIGDTYGDQYNSKTRNVYKSRKRNQDAHEAIRPTSSTRTPGSIKGSLTNEQFKLYKLIWERFVASQMEAASYETISVKIGAGNYQFRSSGSKLVFDGFLLVYNRVEDKEEDHSLPELVKDMLLTLMETKDVQHFTQPPPRYNDASLVKTMEEMGIGRPSTYAPTITTILARRYVVKEEKNFYPTELGSIVNDIMSEHFSNIVDVEFTANMEKELDQVEDGEVEWRTVLSQFYPPFMESYEKAEEEIGKIEIRDEVTDVICENCGRNMVIKYGTYGKFLACPGFPDCHNAKPLYEDANVACPECGGKVLIKKTKKGRPYYGCEKNPECPFMSWNKPTGEKCRKCGSYLVEKGKKEKKIACSNPQCGFVMQLKE